MLCIIKEIANSIDKKKKKSCVVSWLAVSLFPFIVVLVHVKDLIQKLVERHSHLAVHGVCISMAVSLPEAKTPGNSGFSLMTLNK